MKYLIAGLLLMAAVRADSVDSAERPASLCAPAETVLASCPIGAKLASVCKGRGRAVYRFGRPGRVELQAPASHFAERGYAGGGESQVVVSNRGTRYVLYDRLVRTGFGADGRHDAQPTSGLLVQRPGRRAVDRSCGGTAETAIGPAARGALPAGAFVAH